MNHVFAVSYGWTPGEVDAATWPELKELLEIMQDYPPPDLIEMLTFRKQKEDVETALTGGQFGSIPIRKGRITRRPTVGK